MKERGARSKAIIARTVLPKQVDRRGRHWCPQKLIVRAHASVSNYLGTFSNSKTTPQQLRTLSEIILKQRAESTTRLLSLL